MTSGIFIGAIATKAQMGIVVQWMEKIQYIRRVAMYAKSLLHELYHMPVHLCLFICKEEVRPADSITSKIVTSMDHLCSPSLSLPFLSPSSISRSSSFFFTASPSFAFPNILYLFKRSANSIFNLG